MYVDKVMIVFVILLIVSITPVSAFEINQTTHTNQTINILKEDTQELNDKMTELKVHTNKIGECWDYITDNWYAFWNWGTISDKIDEIKTELNTILPITDDIESLSKRVEEDAKNLQATINNTNQTIDETATQNAEEMIKQLNKSLNISLKLNPVTQPKIEDIVQYKSQGKYYRYLQLTNITNNSVTLHGTRKQFTIPLKEFNVHSKFKLTATTPINNTQIVNQAYQIQNTELKNQQEELKTQNETPKSIKSAFMAVAVGCTATGLGAVYFVIGGLVLIGQGDPDGALWLKIAIGYAVLSVLLGTAAIILYSIYPGMFEKILNKWNVVMDNLNDLNSYQHGSPIAKDMNLTIKRNDVLLASLNASDDEKGVLSYKIVTKPEHGNLELKTNGTFSYIPTEDYMGDDSFTYKANNGFSDSNIANVTIKVTPPTPPVANDMNLTIKQGKRLNNTFNITNPYNTSLTFIIIKPPMHGTVKIDQGNFIYIPTTTYTGIDSFTYRVNNGLDSNIAKITINIKSLKTWI